MPRHYYKHNLTGGRDRVQAMEFKAYTAVHFEKERRLTHYLHGYSNTLVTHLVYNARVCYLPGYK